MDSNNQRYGEMERNCRCGKLEVKWGTFRAAEKVLGVTLIEVKKITWRDF